MPRLLDLFCGAGGAGMGYHRAGWEVVGVDINPQPHYPFECVQANAIDLMVSTPMWWDGFDVIHASPPCQGYSPHVSSRSSPYAGTLGKDEPVLIGTVRALIEPTGLPYVIENVVGARDRMLFPAMACGTMFGPPITRHRYFESSADIFFPEHPLCAGVAIEYATLKGWDVRDMTVTGKGRRAGTKARWAEIMGWPDYQGTQHGLREAIPPAYTEWIGTQLLEVLHATADR